MRSLYLAWNGSGRRAWYPIGRLDFTTPERYRFRYTRGMLEAQRNHRFPVLPAFPELQRTYESSELFPLFQNRVLHRHRKDFADYLSSLSLSEPDPIAILAITGGERQTDSLEVLPRIEPHPDGYFACRFFVQGMRGLPEASIARAFALMEGERIDVSLERRHPEIGSVIQLNAHDHCIGWAPRYLTEVLRNVTCSAGAIEARVLRINRGEGIPAARRVLVELAGHLPRGIEPMSSELFGLIGGTRKSALTPV